MTTLQPTASQESQDGNLVVDVDVTIPHGIKSPAFNIPAVCTCCLAPTENRVTAKWSTSRKYASGGYRVTETHRASLDFCACPECVAHEQEYRKKRALMIRIVTIPSTLITAILLAALALLLFGRDPAGDPFFLLLAAALLCPLILVLLFLFIADFFVALRPLDARHASRTTGVRLTGQRSFQFDNPAYARLFAARNGSGARLTLDSGVSFDSQYKVDLKVKKKTLNYKIRDKSLLAGAPLLEIAGLSTLLSVVLSIPGAFAIYRFIAQPEARTGTSICGGVLLLFMLGLLASLRQE